MSSFDSGIFFFDITFLNGWLNFHCLSYSALGPVQLTFQQNISSGEGGFDIGAVILFKANIRSSVKLVSPGS